LERLRSTGATRVKGASSIGSPYDVDGEVGVGRDAKLHVADGAVDLAGTMVFREVGLDVVDLADPSSPCGR
jgi:hypothetical protein